MIKVEKVRNKEGMTREKKLEGVVTRRESSVP